MKRRLSSVDDGAILIFVLLIVTMLGVAVAAVAAFGFTAPQAIKNHAARARIVNALDSGLRAGVENSRLGVATPCNGTALAPVDDGLGSPALPTLTVSVACKTAAGEDMFIVTAQQTNAGSPTSNPYRSVCSRRDSRRNGETSGCPRHVVEAQQRRHL